MNCPHCNKYFDECKSGAKQEPSTLHKLYGHPLILREGASIIGEAKTEAAKEALKNRLAAIRHGHFSLPEVNESSPGPRKSTVSEPVRIRAIKAWEREERKKNRKNKKKKRK